MDPAMIELNENNYCDQKPVTMQFSFEEHDVINDVLNHALDAYDFAGYTEIFDMPDDSPTKQKYNMLLELRERSHALWIHRFDNPPYNND